MALRKLLILRRPRSGRLEGRGNADPGTRRFPDSLFRGGDGEEKMGLIWLVSHQ